ncbi:hypothetical protein G6N76_20530 [Rhizobium daejeonense]|uniref:Low-complexity protein n=1 Tax=Rhizobium daejeonense TaxID=240521 RepID=A0A6M1S4E4_9HYPH|nr:hypothetical protein [Rhizobium daejeonense]NGO66049.1 hypothetical protein [Rhizobium daejeonense]
MTYRKLLLAASAGTGLFVAFGSLAMSFDTLKMNAASAIDLVDYDEGDDDDQHDGHRRHHDDRGRQASNDCRGDDEDDDDDDGACGGRGRVMQQQNATPPANGLFAPGSKPTVQVN